MKSSFRKIRGLMDLVVMDIKTISWFTYVKYRVLVRCRGLASPYDRVVIKRRLYIRPRRRVETLTVCLFPDEMVRVDRVEIRPLFPIRLYRCTAICPAEFRTREVDEVLFNNVKHERIR